MKKLWKFLLLDFFVLLLLFLASSTDVLLKERVKQSHRITVMLDNTTAGAMNHFKKGANQAAIEKKMDINFIDLSVIPDLEGRRLALQKELEKGTEGLVLHCEDSAQAEALIASVSVGDPVVTYNTTAQSPRIKGQISVDVQGEVALLVEAILLGRTLGQDIALVAQKTSSQWVLMVHEKIETALFAQGIVVRRVVLEDLSMAATGAMGLAHQGGNILVSADLGVVQGLGEGRRLYALDIPLYGIGWSIGCRSLLEGGYIDGLVVGRSYEGGYLAVAQVAGILRGEGQGQEAQYIESLLVTPETMYQRNVTTALFPYG